MKSKIILLVWLGVFSFFLNYTIYADTIYTNDGQVIKAKNIKEVKNTMWYEKTIGGSTGKLGISKDQVEKIVPDTETQVKETVKDVKNNNWKQTLQSVKQGVSKGAEKIKEIFANIFKKE